MGKILESYSKLGTSWEWIGKKAYNLMELIDSSKKIRGKK